MEQSVLEKASPLEAIRIPQRIVLNNEVGVVPKTLRVQADSYPLAVPLDQDSSELLHAIFCEAIEQSAVRVAKTVAESHAEFQTAFAGAVEVVRRRS